MLGSRNAASPLEGHHPRELPDGRAGEGVQGHFAGARAGPGLPPLPLRVARLAIPCHTIIDLVSALRDNRPPKIPSVASNDVFTKVVERLGCFC